MAVLEPLSRELGATVVAHDTPGFGLTERSSDLRRYTQVGNARLARGMLDVAEREARAGDGERPRHPPGVGEALGGEGERDGDGDGDREGRGAESTERAGAPVRRVLIGHSMGGLVGRGKLTPRYESTYKFSSNFVFQQG